MVDKDDLTDEDGTALVGLARRAVSDHLLGRQTVPDDALKSRFSFRAGVFVTLNSGGSLRGCIGFVAPRKRLYGALVEAAVAAATRDPRFLPVQSGQLGRIKFEVTVLSEPQKMAVSNPNQYLSGIRIGMDGLLIRRNSSSGLLLPQVPAEYGWSPQEFLEHACEKAGLPRDSWRDESTEVLRFGGTVFREG